MSIIISIDLLVLLVQCSMHKVITTSEVWADITPLVNDIKGKKIPGSHHTSTLMNDYCWLLLSTILPIGNALTSPQEGNMCLTTVSAY